MVNQIRQKRSPMFLLGECLLAAFAIALCWHGVSWAFKPGLVLMMDEVGNLTRFLGGSYFAAIHPIPEWIYNDRPTGFALERLLFDIFGFDYSKQVICFIALHFANCVMAFALFRRLGLGVPLCLAAIGVYGSLSTTALTATYIGAVFDVLCLFFILGSALAILSQKRGASALSAFLFLMALWSKEFAVVVPFLLALLILSRLPPSPARVAFVSVVRRLWLHFVIGFAFILRYLSFIPEMRRRMGPQDPYRMHWSFHTVLQAFGYYTSLIFGAEGLRWTRRPAPIGLILGAILIYGLIRRRGRLVFGIAAYILTLLPVALIPGIRSEWYLYAPQLFLILVIFLLIEEIVDASLESARWRWIASAAVAIVCLLWGASFEGRPYSRNRANFILTTRTTISRSTRDALARFGRVPAGSHVYVNHGDAMPWLFEPGPCDFLKVVNLQRSITCVLHKPEALLRNLYEEDKGPKFFVNYHADGSLSELRSSPARPD